MHATDDYRCSLTICPLGLAITHYIVVCLVHILECPPSGRKSSCTTKIYYPKKSLGGHLLLTPVTNENLRTDFNPVQNINWLSAIYQQVKLH